jgi:hypothetical protein
MRQITFPGPGNAADHPGVAPAPKGKCGAGARSNARAVRILIGSAQRTFHFDWCCKSFDWCCKSATKSMCALS